jgi:hypothetical protein
VTKIIQILTVVFLTFTEGNGRYISWRQQSYVISLTDIICLRVVMVCALSKRTDYPVIILISKKPLFYLPLSRFECDASLDVVRGFHSWSVKELSFLRRIKNVDVRDTKKMCRNASSRGAWSRYSEELSVGLCA